MKLDEPLTFPAAAEEIGWKPDPKGDYRAAGRRLLRRCRARELELGQQFIIRDSADRPVKVTLGALTRFLPDCVPSRVDTLATSIRSLLEEVEERAREIVEERLKVQVEPELQRLHNRDEELAKELEKLAKVLAIYSKAASLPKAEPRGAAGNHSGQ